LARFALLKVSRPIALIGARYVFEGATNGGVFIAKAIERAYGPGLIPTGHLKPYGEAQAERWGTFARGLAALPLSGEEEDLVVRSACHTFEEFIDLMDSSLQFLEPRVEATP
ncbi:MAG: biliverdin-producing heme oxygenase, partial [Myxococcota bacterium]